MVQKCKKSLIFFTHFMKFHALCSDPNFPGSRGCYPGKWDSQNSKIPGISRDGKSRAEALVAEYLPELTKSIVKVLVLGFLSCIGIGIGIVKSIFQVLVLVLVLLRDFSKYWYWYWYC